MKVSRRPARRAGWVELLRRLQADDGGSTFVVCVELSPVPLKKRSGLSEKIETEPVLFVIDMTV